MLSFGDVGVENQGPRGRFRGPLGTPYQEFVPTGFVIRRREFLPEEAEAPFAGPGPCGPEMRGRSGRPGCAAMFQGLAIRYPTCGSVKM